MLWKEVDKSGGSSQGNAEGVGRCSNIIISRQEYMPIVVVSAYGRPLGTKLTKATDLLRLMEEALYEGDFDRAEKHRREFIDRAGEIRAARGIEHIVDYAASPQTTFEWNIQRIGNLFGLYKAIHKDKIALQQVRNRRVLRNFIKDMFMARGEPIQAGIQAADLIHQGMPALAYHGSHLGLITDANFQNASPVANATILMRDRLFQLELKQRKTKSFHTPVIAGYAAFTEGSLDDILGIDLPSDIKRMLEALSESGIETTLGRGASDFSAAKFGRAADCPVYIWTDVPGLYDGTPGIITDTNARILNQVSYDEGFQLATHGTTAIHPRAVEEGKQSGKPMFIKSTFQPDEPGTKIVTNRVQSTGIVKAVTVLPGVTIVRASCTQSQYSAFIRYLHEEGISTPLDSYTEGDAQVILGIPDLTEAVHAQLKELGLSGNSLKYSKNKYLVRVVGDGIGNIRNFELLLEVQRILFKAGIEQSKIYTDSRTVFPVVSIHESSIGFVVGYRAGPAIAKALYNAFVRPNHSTVA